MRPDPSKEYEIRERRRRRSDLFENPGQVQREHWSPAFSGFSVSGLMRRLLMVLRKFYVAFKYQVYKLAGGFLERTQLPWVKIGIAALAVFIILKKDVQFSINMRSPLSIAGDEEEAAKADAMSLAQTVNLTEDHVPHVTAGALDDKKVRSYIQRFSKVAATEMAKFGIPASIKMAQGILESKAGEHPAALRDNNHFGHPLRGQAFNSAWENWRAHSQLLQDHYPQLFRSGNSYKKWARALQKSDYGAGRDGYARQLVEIIEKYQLYLLD